MATIEIPDELATDLRRDADREGVTLEVLLAQVHLRLITEGGLASAKADYSLTPREERQNGHKPRTLADRLAGKVGRVGDGSGAHPIAENHSRLFGEIIAEKRKEGHI